MLQYIRNFFKRRWGARLRFQEINTGGRGQEYSKKGQMHSYALPLLHMYVHPSITIKAALNWTDSHKHKYVRTYVPVPSNCIQRGEYVSCVHDHAVLGAQSYVADIHCTLLVSSLVEGLHHIHTYMGGQMSLLIWLYIHAGLGYRHTHSVSMTERCLASL